MADILNVGAIAQSAFTNQYNFFEELKQKRAEFAQAAIMDQFNRQMKEQQLALAQQEEARMQEQLGLDKYKIYELPEQQRIAAEQIKTQYLGYLDSLPQPVFDKLFPGLDRETAKMLVGAVPAGDEFSKFTTGLVWSMNDQERKIALEGIDAANQIALKKTVPGKAAGGGGAGGGGAGGGGGAVTKPPVQSADGKYHTEKISAKELGKLKARATGLLDQFYQVTETENEDGGKQTSRKSLPPGVSKEDYLTEAMSAQDVAALAGADALPAGVLTPETYRKAQAYAAAGEDYGAAVYHALMDKEAAMYEPAGESPSDPYAGGGGAWAAARDAELRKAAAPASSAGKAAPASRAGKAAPPKGPPAGGEGDAHYAKAKKVGMTPEDAAKYSRLMRAGKEAEALKLVRKVLG